MNSYMAENEMIASCLKELKLPAIKDLLEDIITDATEQNWSFSHLSLRSGSKATIITTNLPFTRWEEIMKDRVLCSALVDRLCHKAYLVNMTGKSYRIRETQNMFKK